MKIEKEVSWSLYGKKTFKIKMVFTENEKEEMLMTFKKEIDLE